jgi:hypothetical protein
MSVLDFPPTKQVVFVNGDAVWDDAFPDDPANIMQAGPEQSVVRYSSGRPDRYRPNDALHHRDTAAKAGKVAAAAAVAPQKSEMSSAPNEAPAVGSNTLSRAQHKDRINGAWLKGEAAYIETGKFLLAAKAELEPDAFKVLVRELDFDPANGRKFMRVAARPILCAPAHNKIPPSWTIRYELSKLDDAKLNAAIDAGRVHLKMTRKDAIALHRPLKPDGDKKGAAPKKSKVEIARAALSALSKDERTELVRGEPVELFLAGMSNDQRDTLAERLIGQQISTASKSSKFAINSTCRLHVMLRCAEQKEPSAEDIRNMIGAGRAMVRDAEHHGISRSSIIIAVGAPKKGGQKTGK